MISRLASSGQPEIGRAFRQVTGAAPQFNLVSCPRGQKECGGALPNSYSVGAVIAVNLRGILALGQGDRMYLRDTVI